MTLHYVHRFDWCVLRCLRELDITQLVVLWKNKLLTAVIIETKLRCLWRDTDGGNETVFGEARGLFEGIFLIQLGKSYSNIISCVGSVPLNHCFLCTSDHDMIWVRLFLPSYFQLTHEIVACGNLHPFLCKINDNTFRLDNVIPNKKSTTHILYNVKLARDLGEASVGDVREKDIQDNRFFGQVQLISNAFDVHRRIGSPFARRGAGFKNRLIN